MNHIECQAAFQKNIDTFFLTGQCEQLTGLVSQSFHKTCCEMDWILLPFKFLDFFVGYYGIEDLLPDFFKQSG